MPLGKNVGANIQELTAANKSKKKKRPRRQIVAIALEAARKADAKILKKK